jgi:hypothetical protein
MNRTPHQHNKRIGIPVILLTLGLTLINACSSIPTIPDTSAGSYSLTITTQPTDTREGLENRYAGQVISYHPDAGFAVIRTNTKPSNDPAIKAIEKNHAVFTAPVVTTNAVPLTPENTTRSANVWMGGWSAWSGGWSAWSGGWSAWSGGTSTIPTLPAENSAAFNLIRLPHAQKISRNYGAGIKVAVLDTGIDTTHPMFTNRLAPSAEWKDFVDNDSNPQEVGTTSDRAFGHGTGVAGIILQVAPRATILPVRVLDKTGMGNLDAVVQGIDWALQRGVQVINLSLGSSTNTTALQQVVQLAASRGVYIVASAGNEGLSGGVTFPAATTFGTGTVGYVFGIASANNTDILSSFSNYGTTVFGIAPGESLYSAFPGNRLAAMTGTSFAAPIYSGALALGLKELPAGGNAAAFSSYMIDTMRRGSIYSDNTPVRGSVNFGYGRIQLENLIRNLPGWTPTVAYGATNFIKNGTFETNSLTNWAVNGATVSTAARSGSYALRLNPGQAVQQSISGLKPNTSYTLTAWTRVENAGTSGNNTVLLSVYSHGGVQQDLEARGTIYQARSLTFTTGPTSTFANIGLKVWSGYTSVGFVDDITLREAGY